MEGVIITYADCIIISEYYEFFSNIPIIIFGRKFGLVFQGNTINGLPSTTIRDTRQRVERVRVEVLVKCILGTRVTVFLYPRRPRRFRTPSRSDSFPPLPSFSLSLNHLSSAAYIQSRRSISLLPFGTIRVVRCRGSTLPFLSNRVAHVFSV